MKNVKFSAPPPVPVEVLRRLHASKKLDEQVPRMGILDMLSVPKTIDELEAQICDWRDCRMFFPMEGMPRAYMQVPVDAADGQTYYARWMYVVIGWIMHAPRSKAESAICQMMWKQFIALRRQFDTIYPDEDPVLLFRRHVEISEEGRRKVGTPCFEHDKARCKECAHGPLTRVTLRIAIPGLDHLASNFPQDSAKLPILTEDML